MSTTAVIKRETGKISTTKKEEADLLQLEPIRKAEELHSNGQGEQAVQAYLAFILSPLPSEPIALEKARGVREAAILRAARMLPKDSAKPLTVYIRALESIWVSFPRAKTAKIIKDLLALFDELPVQVHNEEQVHLLKDLIAWCEQDKRVFLRQALQLRLAELYLASREFSESLALTQELLITFRRLDDKLSLVQTELLVSRTYFALKNVAKSRAALTAARTAANAIYCPPLILASIDLQTGLLHAEETDFGTAFSYFVEALDNYILAEVHPKGATALKYMLLCKIMLGRSDELDSLTKSKNARNYEIGREIEAMYAIGHAYQGKSIKQLEKALDAYPDALGFDPIIQSHFASLYDKLLEQNILKIIGPYQRLPINTIAQEVALGNAAVEAKLGQMIIDKVFHGIIDQAGGFVQILKVIEKDEAYENALKTLDNLESAVTVLYALYQKKI